MHKSEIRIERKQLRTERKRRGWTYEDVANRIDLPDAHTVGRWERGVTLPSPYYRQKLSQLYGKSIEELGLLDEVITPLDEEYKVFDRIVTPYDSFVGRKREVDAVCDLLKSPEVRLLTLCGAGGIGKTRLAVEVVALLRDCFPDGICSVALIDVRDPAFVLPTIAAELGIQDSVSRLLIKLIKNFLRERRLLLFLDNFEHVASEAPCIEELLLACRDIKVLVTSRHVLNIRDEHLFAVPQLALPDVKQLPEVEELKHCPAVALFIQRAQTYLPSFTLTTGNARAVAELCTHLDGLPLAIELAAARIKLFSPQELLTRLLQDQSILKSDVRTLPKRQRTLYAMIKSSYDLLEQQEQWLLRHLSIFVGSITLKTIEALFRTGTNDASNVVDIVNSLLNKSLLQRIELDDGETRFLMLETIRNFAGNYLKVNGELESLQQRYADYYLGLVEQATPHLKDRQQISWLKMLEPEVGNLRAVLQWLIEQKDTARALRFVEPFGKFCGLRGYWSEERHWLKAVLQLPQVSELPRENFLDLRGKVLRRAGHLAYRLRDLAEAQTLLEQSVVDSREVEDWYNLAGSLSGLGWVYYRQNTIDSAGQLLRECVEIAYRSGSYWSIANALESLGRFVFYRGDVDEAYNLLQKGLLLARQHLDKESLARILMTMVTLEAAWGNHEQASALARESFDLAQELGTKPLIALALDTCGNIAWLQGEYGEAKRYFEERLGMAEDLGDLSAIISWNLKIADIALAENDGEQARYLLDEALLLLEQTGDSADRAIAYCILGDLKRLQGDVAQASACYLDVLRQYDISADQRKVGRCLIGLAHVFVAQERSADAAYLLGFLESHLTVAMLYPAQRTDLNQAKEMAQKQLGEIDFAHSWSQGRGASLAQVLSTILDKLC